MTDMLDMLLLCPKTCQGIFHFSGDMYWVHFSFGVCAKSLLVRGAFEFRSLQYWYSLKFVTL